VLARGPQRGHRAAGGRDQGDGGESGGIGHAAYYSAGYGALSRAIYCPLPHLLWAKLRDPAVS
jgi:hypothetical protein